MTKAQYYRVLDGALSTAKHYSFCPNDFYYMLDGIILCALHDDGINTEEYAEIITYKDKVAEEIGK